MIGFVVFSLKRAWQGFWRNALMSLAATATMVLMLMLLAGFWIIHTGLLAGLEFTESKVNVVAKLYDEVTPRQVDQLKTQLQALPEVASVEYISKDEALRRFRANRLAQGQQDLTQFLDANPFHASMEISLRDPSFYAVVQQRLSADPAVQGVENIGNLVERVLTITNFL